MFRPVACATLALLLAAASAFAAADRIAGPIDSTRSVVLPGNLHRLARAESDQGLADPSLPIRYITVLFKPAPGLPEFLNTPHNQWLKPEDFAQRFGLSEADIAKVTAWLTSEGLQVHDVARGRHWITFSGTAEQVGRALHTEIHRYQVQGKLHYANASEPSIPEALSGVVAGFRGLNDFRALPQIVKAVPQYTLSGAHYLAPGDLATIYDLNPLFSKGVQGTGVTLVVAGQTDIFLSDIAAYRRLFGLSSNIPTQMLFGDDPGLSPPDLEEADLDLEISGAAAPSASIVFANSLDVFLSLQYAIDQNLGQVMSLSYGNCELDSTPGYEVIAQQANAQGITIVAGSGDTGAATCDDGNPTPQVSTGATVNWPTDLPEVTGVGGTEFSSSNSFWSSSNGANGGSARSYIPETTWNDTAAEDSLAASGGGASMVFSKPPWQAGPGVPNDNARDEPDVSMVASPVYAPYIFVSGDEEVLAGGTSGAAPLFAGIIALVNEYLMSNGGLSTPGLGNINPALYRLAQSAPSAFHDITSGNNEVPCAQSTPDCVNGMLGYSAGPGYDLATGLGSVDGFNLASNWSSGRGSTTTLTISPSSAALTGTVQLTATVKGSGSAPTGSVSFVVDGAGALGEVSVATVNLTPAAAAGTATASVALTGSQIGFGDGAILAVYSGDSVYEGSHGGASFALQTSSSAGSVVVPFATPNPVPESPDGQWQFSLGLTEVAGVPTALTGFSINGTAQNLNLWSSTNITGFGNIYALLDESSLNAPGSLNLSFSGRDFSGRTWTQQLTLPYLADPGTTTAPSIRLTTATPAVFQNTKTEPACEWSQQLTVEETGGFWTFLDGLLVNAQNLPTEIQNTFGTTRLAPYGFLQGNLCLAGVGPTAIQLLGVAESGYAVGNAVGSSVNTTLQTAPAVTPVSWSSPASGASYAMNVASPSQSPAPVTIPVSFSSGSPSWTVSIAPANSASGWISVSPLSGTGSGTVSVSGSAAGLSPGAYTAALTFASTGALPQSITVLVTLTVGASSSISIAGLVNNFSGSQTAAPGMIAAVFGSKMAPPIAPAVAQGLPLPLSLEGVSATVNGVTAPLYYVSPGQIDIQIPYETGAGTAILAINNNGGIATFPFTVAETAPGIYASAIDNSTGALVSSSNAGAVLLLFMTGEGDVTPTLATGATPAPETNADLYPKPRLPVAVTIGGVKAALSFQGIPNGLAGATQIDFTLPANAPTGPQQIVVTVGGVAAPPINLTVNP